MRVTIGLHRVTLPSLVWTQLLPRSMECRRGLAMRILSVCPSVKRVICDKMEERSVQFFLSRFFISYERSISLVFWEEWLVGATPFTWNFGSTGPRWSEIADFQPIFARSSSAVTPNKNTNTNRKSTTRFPMSPRWTSYVVPKLPPEGWLENAVSEIWTTSCDNSEMVPDRMSVTITH